MRTLPARPWLPALREIVKQMLGPSPVDAPNDVALMAERSDRQRSQTRGARQAERSEAFDHLETDSAGLLAWLLVESRPVPESNCIRFDVHLLGSGSATGSARRAAAFY
jgi:hypothetical protein